MVSFNFLTFDLKCVVNLVRIEMLETSKKKKKNYNGKFI